MARNIELLEKTMQFIIDNPQKHDQSTWMNMCGTAGCFAGWACFFNGDTIHYHSFGDVRIKGRDIESYTTDLLGLDRDEARCLFDSNNSRDMLQLMVKDLVNGDKLRPRPEYDKEVHD